MCLDHLLHKKWQRTAALLGYRFPKAADSWNLKQQVTNKCPCEMTTANQHLPVWFWDWRRSLQRVERLLDEYSHTSASQPSFYWLHWSALYKKSHWVIAKSGREAASATYPCYPSIAVLFLQLRSDRAISKETGTPGWMPYTPPHTTSESRIAHTHFRALCPFLTLSHWVSLIIVLPASSDKKSGSECWNQGLLIPDQSRGTCSFVSIHSCY